VEVQGCEEAVYAGQAQWEEAEVSELHGEIRAALSRAARGMTARQLLSECDSAADVNDLVKQVHVLKGLGRVLADGMRDSQVVYKIGSWPVNGAETREENVKQPPDRPYLGPEKPRRSAAGLREGLFEMLEQLRAGKVDVQTAKTYAALSMTIIKSVEVQLEYERMRIANEVPAHLSDMSLVPALEHKPSA
jgi:hypothetical protein